MKYVVLVYHINTRTGKDKNGIKWINQNLIIGVGYVGT
jgi:hypothetical protein